MVASHVGVRGDNLSVYTELHLRATYAQNPLYYQHGRCYLLAPGQYIATFLNFFSDFSIRIYPVFRLMSFIVPHF